MRSEQFPISSPERREGVIEKTKDFITAIREGRIEEARAWLDNVKANRDQWPQYSDPWVDDRERELFHAYCEQDDFVNAKQIVETTLSKHSKEGRRKRLEQLAGKPYDQI